MTHRTLAKDFIGEVMMMQHYFQHEEISNCNLYYRIGKAQAIHNLIDRTRLSDKMLTEFEAWEDTYHQIRHDIDF